MSTSDAALAFEVLEKLDLNQIHFALLINEVNESAERHSAAGDPDGKAGELFSRVHRLRDMQLHARLPLYGDEEISYSEFKRRLIEEKSRPKAEVRAQMKVFLGRGTQRAGQSGPFSPWRASSQ